MFRASVVLVLIGVMVFGWAVSDWWLGLGSSSVPQDITASALSENGPGDNRHVRITDFGFGDFIVESESSSSNEWNRAWVIVAPNGSGRLFLLRTDDAKNQLDLAALQLSGELLGMVAGNGKSLGTDVRSMIKRDYPGIQFEKLWIVDHNRSPTSTVVFLLKLVGAIAICGVGGYVMWLGRDELE